MHAFAKIILLAFVLSLSMVSFMSPVPSAYAADCTAVQSGDWNDPATWDSIVSGCTYVIPNDITVTITPATGGLSYVINYGAIINNSNITMNSAWEIQNHGSFINNASLTVDYFYNYGSLTNNQEAYLSIYDYFSTTGNFDNYGGLGIHPGKNWGNDQAGILNNYGSITNNGRGSNNGTFNNDGSIYNTGSDTEFNNSGIFNNDGIFDNSGDVFNSNTFYNNGTFTNYCLGVFEGNVIIGNPTVENFVTDAPNLIAPTNRTHTRNTTPTFRWSSIATADAYRLMVYLQDRSFELKKTVYDNRYTLASNEALTPNKYFWRVRTLYRDCSRWREWSQRNILFID
jgi:hypothetical protein